MFGLIKDLDEKQKAIAVYCRKSNHLKKARFFPSGKSANRVSILEWRMEGAPLMIIQRFGDVQFSNMPITFSIYEDIAYGGLFTVNNDTLEVLWAKDALPIYNETNTTVKGCVFAPSVFGTNNIILMQDMASKSDLKEAL